MLVGPYHELGAVAGRKFEQEVGDVSLDGGFADDEIGSDFGVGAATGH